MERLRTARVVLAGLGFALALAGVVLEDHRIVWLAIVALGLAFLLRVYLRRRERDATLDAEIEDTGHDDAAPPHG